MYSTIRESNCLRRDTMATATLIKESISLGLVHPLSWWVHGSVQADMVLEKELRVLHLDEQITEGICASH